MSDIKNNKSNKNKISEIKKLSIDNTKNMGSSHK